MTPRPVSLYHSDPLFIPSLYAFNHKIKDFGHISDSSPILPALPTVQLCLWWVAVSHQVPLSCHMDGLPSDVLKFKAALFPVGWWFGVQLCLLVVVMNISEGAVQGQENAGTKINNSC